MTDMLSIRDARLYRAEYGTFDQYCKSRWGFNASRARQLIGAASVIENIQSVTMVTPQTESQARPLASLPPKDQPKAWEAANETPYKVLPTIFGPVPSTSISRNNTLIVITK